MHSSRKPTPEFGVADIERNQARRRDHLGSMKGRAELQEALLMIRSMSSSERIDGARALKRLAPADAFEPLLAAIETERDTPIKIELLKALHWSVESESLPDGAIARLEDIIIQGTDPAVATEAMMAIYHCSDGTDANRVLTELRDRIDSAFGKTDPVSLAVSKVIMHLRQTGAM